MNGKCVDKCFSGSGYSGPSEIPGQSLETRWEAEGQQDPSQSSHRTEPNAQATGSTKQNQTDVKSPSVPMKTRDPFSPEKVALH